MQWKWEGGPFDSWMWNERFLDLALKLPLRLLLSPSPASHSFT